MIADAVPVEGAADPFELLRLSRFIAERSPLPKVAVEGVAHVVRYVNPAFARLVGKAPEELIGRPFAEVVPEGVKNGCTALLDRVFRTGKPENLTEQEHCHEPPVYWSYAMWAILGEDDRPAGVMIQVTDSTETAIFRARATEMNEALLVSAVRQQELNDIIRQGEQERRELEITARKRAEEDLQQKTAELRATTQQLWQAARLAGVGELAASVAHELNNPLGIVSLRVERMLAKTPADDPRHKHLEIIEQEVERMARLVGNLLQFSRAGVDKVSTVNVGEEIRKTLELVEHLLRRQKIAVEPDFGPGVPAIYADRQQLRQILLNLFTNAVDAMPGGGRLIPRLRGGELPGGVPAVVIEVADTGVGILPELIPRVTEPFFTTKPDGKGTGLGLAICRRIAQQHQGTIEVESRPGEGTTVRITLPVRPATNVSGLQAE